MVAKLTVLEKDISTFKLGDIEYINITDIARYKNTVRTDDLIRNWLRNRNTIEFLGIWEQLNNPNFKPVEFDGFKIQAGLNSFALTPKQWIGATNAIGLISKAGRYGGTYAQKDIAFEFASWISVEFKLYLIHTDAIKENLVPDIVSPSQVAHVYATEADLLNVALFGVTAKEWREVNPNIKGNMRDHANVHQLVCLANLESLNAHFIDKSISQTERLTSLNDLAIQQMQILSRSITRLPSKSPVIDNKSDSK